MIKIIDLNFQGHSQTVAAFLIETSAGPVLLETGPHSMWSNLVRGVNAAGYDMSDIRHVLLTHIHLDHAGASWALAQQGATVYVHPVGAPHLIDPERLMASARRIYREDMDRLWGDMQAIPEERVKLIDHEATVQVGQSVFRAWHTPGHAVHHIAWQLDHVLFTGDVGGVKINDVQVVPPCPPPEFQLEDWLNSLALIRGLNPDMLYLTHFGPVEDVSTHLDILEATLHDWAGWMKIRWERGDSPETILPEFRQYVIDQLRRAGADEANLVRYETANPVEMNLTGLLRYWKKRSPA
ncbi:MAG: MBL fold metallo-hydrolase [Calditrichaeota bacterium]|nr:MBL fold metallo-hydrolase [Calditrichota bacterium]